MSKEWVDTVIVGGGQAGLAMSYHLDRRGCPHVILERARVAECWRSERWDSLTFQFPNWAMQLPGYPYQGDDPDGFAPRDEVVRFIESYAAYIRAPLRCGVSANSIRQEPGSARFQVQTDGTLIEAGNVVIATGPYQKPAIPQDMQHALHGVFQVHSSRYRNPAQLPDGAVLVVGSGNSGCQIAEDLLRSGRRAYLAVGGHWRAPRRYRGRDCTWWEFALGEFDQPAEKKPARKITRLLTGVDGGHDMDLRRLARDGVVLLGHVLSVQDGKLTLAPDLGDSLKQADAWFDEFLRSADEHVRVNGLDLPRDEGARERLPDPKEACEPLRELDLKAAGVSSVVWASGFAYDFGWVHLPVFGAAGPIHRRGVTNVTGFYFIGLSWLSKRKSSLMAGVGEDAEFIAAHIAGGKEQ